METFALPLLIISTVVMMVMFVASLTTLVLAFIISERTKRLENLAWRLENIEEYLRDLSTSVNDADQSNPDGRVYRSIDGKHTASSLEELIGKIEADPDSIINIDPNQSPEDMKRFFDRLADDDDETPPWKKPK